MGQSDILKFLEKRKRWITTKKISELMKQSRGSVAHVCNKLYKQGLIDLKIITEGHAKNNAWRTKE